MARATQPLRTPALSTADELTRIANLLDALVTQQERLYVARMDLLLRGRAEGMSSTQMATACRLSDVTVRQTIRRAEAR